MHARGARHADDGSNPLWRAGFGASTSAGLLGSGTRRDRDSIVAVPGHAPPLTAGGVLALQRSAGNLAVSALLSPTATHRPTLQRDDEAPTPGGPLRQGTRLLSGKLWLADPAEFLRDKPSLAPTGGLPPLPPNLVEGLIDWGGVGAAYQDRRLVLEDRDRAVITAHWQRWYPVAQALYKLPGAKSLFDTPAAIMNTMSAKMIDSSLAGGQPNLIERFNAQAEQFGVKTSTVSLTVKRF